MAFGVIVETNTSPDQVKFENWQIWHSNIFRSSDTFSYLFNAPIRTKGVATKSYATLYSTKLCYFRIKFVHKVWCSFDVGLRPNIRYTLILNLIDADFLRIVYLNSLLFVFRNSNPIFYVFMKCAFDRIMKSNIKSYFFDYY